MVADFKPPIYEQADLAGENLPPRLFRTIAGLVPDEGVLYNWMRKQYGEPRHQLDILEVGAGGGRMTQILAPYAARLVCTDRSAASLDALSSRFLQAETVHADTQDLDKLLKPARQFDLVGAFWTLNYPIHELLETTEGGRPVQRPDIESGIDEAVTMVDSMTDYIRRDGQLVAYFPDSSSPQQQAITRIWNEVLGGDLSSQQDLTRDVAVKGLQRGAQRNRMNFYATHYEGIAPFPNSEAMVSWYTGHLAQGLGNLASTHVIEQETESLVRTYLTEEGRIDVPVGMYELAVSNR